MDDFVAEILDANAGLNARIAELEAENAKLKAEKAASEDKHSKKRDELLVNYHAKLARQADDLFKARKANIELLAEFKSLRIAAKDASQVAAKLERIEIEMRDTTINSVTAAYNHLMQKLRDYKEENDMMKKTIETIESALTASKAVQSSNDSVIKCQNEVLNISVRNLKANVDELILDNQLLDFELKALDKDYKLMSEALRDSEDKVRSLEEQLEANLEV